MQFKLTDFVVLLAATSALTGVSLATSSPVSAQTQQPATTSPMAAQSKDMMQSSHIAMPHSSFGKLKAELARSQDPTRNAILQAAMDRLQKSHPGGAANDRWSFSLVFTLTWGSMAQVPGNGTIHD
ncbi:MAG: hypothetical protein HY243_15755 [Proteobacteria bacterium]|nr:hypothetical protein [Pseudomonadota bacterium]